MSFRPGYLAYIGVDNAAGSIQNLSTFFDNVDYSFDIESLDTSAFGSAHRSYIPGMNGATFTLSGAYHVTAWSHFTGCIAAQNAGTASFSVDYGPAGSVASQARVRQEVIVTSVSPPSSVGGRVEFSVGLQAVGAGTLGTY
jgi:hypothetical protein